MPILKTSNVLTAMDAVPQVPGKPLVYRLTPPARGCGAACRSVEGTVFILYQRDDCHLCDLALTVLAQARAPAFESVFIDGDAGLETRYGERVPVLCHVASAAELQWPFDVPTVQAWLP